MDYDTNPKHVARGTALSASLFCRGRTDNINCLHSVSKQRLQIPEVPVISRATGSWRQIAQGLHLGPPTLIHLLKSAMFEANISYLREHYAWLAHRKVEDHYFSYERWSWPTMLTGSESTCSCMGFCKTLSSISLSHYIHTRGGDRYKNKSADLPLGHYFLPCLGQQIMRQVQQKLMDPLSFSAISPYQSRKPHGSNSNHVLLAESAPFAGMWSTSNCTSPSWLWGKKLLPSPFLQDNVFYPIPGSLICSSLARMLSFVLVHHFV